MGLWWNGSTADTTVFWRGLGRFDMGGRGRCRRSGSGSFCPTGRQSRGRAAAPSPGSRPRRDLAMQCGDLYGKEAYLQNIDHKPNKWPVPILGLIFLLFSKHKACSTKNTIFGCVLWECIHIIKAKFRHGIQQVGLVTNI
jgi:hypothetical protein